MGSSSQLKKLKASVKAHGLVGQTNGKGKKSLNARKDRESSVQAIREAFNPFDKKFNRMKRDILGRNLQGVAGKPSVQKQNAEEARRQEYLEQKKRENKVGGLRDRRFGEDDPTLSHEEKAQARYAREKQSIYNLESNDNLFSHGSLSLQDDFDEGDLGISDEEFGPKLRKRFERDDEEEEDEDAPQVKKSKNEIMKEVIAKSKMHKHERQMAREEDLNTMSKLESQENMNELYKELMGMSGAAKPEEIADDMSYEKGVKELLFDRRAAPSDRTKTEEEIAKEQAEKRAELEKKRALRMAGELDSESEASEGEPEFEDPDDDDNAAEFGLKAAEKLLNRGSEDEDESENDHAESEDDFDDILSEEEAEEGSDDEIEEDEEPTKGEKKSAGKPSVETKAEIPQNLDDMFDLMVGKEMSEQFDMVQSLFKKYHPSKAEGNKEKRNVFLTVFIEYILQLAEEQPEALLEDDFLNKSLKLVRLMTEKHNDSTTVGEYFKAKLEDIQDSMDSSIHGRGKDYPTRSDLLFFTLVGMIFSASDHYHLVVTPSILLICQHLTQMPLKSIRDAFAGVYLCNVLASYQQLAKRYIPEVILFITRVLVVMGNKGLEDDRDVFIDKVSKSLRASGLKKSIKVQALRLSSFPDELLAEKESIKCQLVLRAALILSNFASLWQDKSAFIEIFAPALRALEMIKTQHKVFDDVYTKITKLTKFAGDSREPLCLQKHKPMAIPSYAPKFEENYNVDKKSYDENRSRQELNKLRHQLKEEKKSALKELRRENKFLAREKIRERRQEAEEYHEKLARLERTIATEEGAEKNKYEREKAARKRGNKRR
ncbi:nucleolar complex protein 14 [Trichomonascus vanleenenianus]|uniref:snoRNA-binding rRNA-processing protein NOP14 n=1 Tax=Trichomonascus vanleenenianus TaxID=2268995 RepID=UPI003ECB761F